MAHNRALSIAFAALLLFSVISVLPASALDPISFTSGSTFSSLNSGRWQHVWNDDTSTAIVFNGSTQYLTAAANTVYDVTTQDFWMFGMFKRTGDSGGEEAFVWKRNTAVVTNPGYLAEINSSDQLQIQLCDGSAGRISFALSTSISTNIWYAWAASFDRDGSVTLYLYNLNTATLTTASTSIAAQQGSLTNTQTFTVARASHVSGGFFPGRMDMLIPPQIGSTLSQAEFLQLAAGNWSGATYSNLYAFNEGATGATVLDRLGSNNLTPQNSPTYTTSVASIAPAEDMTYFVDTLQGSMRTVKYDRLFDTSTTVNTTLSSATNPSSVSSIEKVSGVPRVYTAQLMSTTSLESNIVSLNTGAIITAANFTVTNTGTTANQLGLAVSTNKVYFFYKNSGDVSNIKPASANRGLTGFAEGTNYSPFDVTTLDLYCATATDGASSATDVIYCLRGTNTQNTKVLRWINLSATQLATITGNSPSKLMIADTATLQVMRATSGGTERTFTVTKSDNTVSAVLYTDTWLTYQNQQFDFDGTTRTYKSGEKAYYATSTKFISYSSAGVLAGFDTAFIETADNSTGALTGISSTFYRINDGLVVTGSGTTWTPKTFSPTTIAPVPYSERLSVALVQNNTLFGESVIRLVCDANYVYPQASSILVGDDSDCSLWRTLADSSATVGRTLPYAASKDLVHASPLTAYTLHAFTGTPTDISITIMYGGKAVDRNVFDDGANTQVRLLYSQCYTTVYNRVSTGEELSSGSLCAGDVTLINTIISRTLGLAFWSSSWGVFHQYNETSNILDVTVRHVPAPFDYTIKITDSNGTAVVDDALNSPTEIDIQTYNLTSFAAGAPLKLEVYNDQGKRVYQYYIDNRPLYLAPVAALFENIEFAGWNILWFIPLVFMGLWSRNTASIGILLSVAVITILNWLGILNLPDPVIWLIAIGGIIGSFATRRLFE